MLGRVDDKEIVWIGSSNDDLKNLPDDVQDFIGFALGYAQIGGKHPDAKPLNKGKLKGKGIYEVVDNYDGDTYRAVYTIELKERIYVLHSFQKKSKQGKETSQADINLIKSRYDDAVNLHQQLNKNPPDRNLIMRYLRKYYEKYFPDSN